jgi:hypothetical protein
VGFWCAQFTERMVSAYNPADFVVEVKTGADPVLICKQDSADGQDGASRLPLHGLDCDGIVEALSARGVTQASKPLMSHDAYVQAKGTWAVKKAIRDEDGSLSPEERAASQREDCAAALSAVERVCDGVDVEEKEHCSGKGRRGRCRTAVEDASEIDEICISERISAWQPETGEILRGRSCAESSEPCGRGKAVQIDVEKIERRSKQEL